MADALPVFLFSAALLGAGTAFIWPASYAMSADIYPPERRGKVVGFLNVFQLLGFGGGALIGAVLVERYAAIMFVVAATSIGSAALVTFTLVPRYHNHVLPAAPSWAACASFSASGWSSFRRWCSSPRRPSPWSSSNT